jgi:hypothetical protein
MKYFLFSFFYLIIHMAQAQDLHIYYNLYRDSLWYEKNGKQTKDLAVKKGKQVYLHLVEYNNYIYQSEIVTTFHSTPPPGFENESNSFLGLMPSLIGSLIPGGAAGLPMMNMPVFGSILSAMSAPNALTQARGDQEDLEEYKGLLKEMESESFEINSQLTEINKRLKSSSLLLGDMSFVNSLSVNPNIAPSVIKELLMTYYNEALMIEDGASFEIKDISELNLKLQELPLLQSNVASKVGDYNKKLSELRRLHNKLKNSDHGIEALYPLLKQYDQQQNSISGSVATLENKVAMVKNIGEIDHLSAIQKVYIKYMETINNNFSITYHTEATSKFILYELKIYLRDSNVSSTLAPESSLQIYKTLKLKINTYGNFGVSTSMGIQGAAFNNTPQTYYVQNNVLTAEDADKYVPLISSMVNLSYQLKSAVTPALSLGFGVPLTNQQAADKLAFFVGPSIMIGKSQDLVISGGFMFSKVKRLSKNFQVGDEIVIGDGIIPTEGKLESGYFLGISYNLGGK